MQRAFHPTALLPRRQVGGDLLGLPVRIDDNMLHAGPGQPVQRVVQQGTMAELQQRLRRMVRQRPHPQPKSGGQQHRLSDIRHPRFSPMAPSQRKEGPRLSAPRGSEMREARVRDWRF